MISNPEFKKYIWLELTPVRLVLMPMVLLAIFFIVYLFNIKNVDGSFINSLRTISIIIFIILVFVWGSKNVIDSLVNEFNEKTWDSQRMTSITPWTMLIGKVFGSPVYAWYGAVQCVLVYLITSWFRPDFINSIYLLLTIIFLTLTCYAISLSLILQEISKNKDLGKLNGSSYLSIIIVICITIIPFINQSINFSTSYVFWYTFLCSKSILLLSTSVFFLFWSFIGLYRNFRREFQYRNSFWIWVLFIISMMVYFAGYITNKFKFASR